MTLVETVGAPRAQVLLEIFYIFYIFYLLTWYVSLV